MGTRIPYSCDTAEDYWEDASVSLSSSHSWDAPSSPWLGASTPVYAKIDEEDETKRFSGLGSHPSRPHRDVNEYVTCSKGRRSFPPPLASSSTLSIKEGGRFVLKEMDADRPHGFLRAQRGDGRLRLQLVLPDEVNDEEDVHKESSPPVDDVTESKVDFLAEFGHAEHDAHGEETMTSNQEDCSTSDEEVIRRIYIDNVGRCVSFDNKEGLWSGGHVLEVEDFYAGRPPVQDVGSECMEHSACSTSQDVCMDVRCAILDTSLAQQDGLKNSKLEGEAMSPAFDGFYSSEPHRDISTCGGKEAIFLETDNFLTFGKLEMNQLVAESSNSSIEAESLWNVDVSNQALANLSPWSPKKMCLHQPIINMRPAFGLAMS